ncbi:MAG: DUF58 domain-containing protein [Verrucomicrobiales bacterium]|nr:DUF58 domain-containing protein [Verrucomicrobiales bacterium]
MSRRGKETVAASTDGGEMPLGSEMEHLHLRMRAAAEVLRLPLRSGQWRGLTGQVMGQGTGSSIDFQDQRPYLPGDDPRHINWQATARTGTPTMKLFRQEVSPQVDLVVDLSASMFLTPAKALRVAELVYFFVESSLRLGGSLRVLALRETVEEMPMEHVLGYEWPEPYRGERDLFSALSEVPARLRPGSLRLILTDALTPGAPEAVLPSLMAGQSRVIFFLPYCREEAAPAWAGNVEFLPVETGKPSLRRVPPDVLQRYFEAYGRHFQLWREQALRHGAALARVSAEVGFLEALRAEALPEGAVELG